MEQINKEDLEPIFIVFLDQIIKEQITTLQLIDYKDRLFKAGYTQKTINQLKKKVPQIKDGLDHLEHLQCNMIRTRLIEGKMQFNTAKYLLDISGLDEYKTTEQLLKEGIGYGILRLQ